MAKNSYTFSHVPKIFKPRSRFDLSHRVLTSGNVGTLYPFDVQEVYPGDTFKERVSLVTRLSSTFIRPLMDNLFVDIAYFYCPSRCVDDNFERIFGGGEPEEYSDSNVPPVAPYAYGTVTSKSVADYMGIFPPGSHSISSNCPVTLYPFRIFAKIWNEWFRDENVEQSVYINKTSSETSKQFNSNAWSASNYMGMCPKVNKFHDLFTSCLPAPQKGASVDIPSMKIPVYSMSPDHLIIPDTTYSKIPMHFEATSTGGMTSGSNYDILLQATGSNKGSVIVNNSSQSVGSPGSLAPNNLYAFGDVMNVNDLRYSLALQRAKELDARGGTRYVEYVFSHFGVSNPDARVQRSELLSYRRTPISIMQVTQTTGFDNGSAGDTLGQVAGMSLTSAKSYFSKSFTEHGYVIGVFCIRQFHTYQDGVNALWFRRKKVDFYDPLYANIGEQPVYTRELYYDPSNAASSVFGYNEAWHDLRRIPNRVSGQMRSSVTNSLDVWHLADTYASQPYLNASFLNETPDIVDNVITVDSSEMDQFILDFYVQHIAYRRLPSYSVPSVV